MSQCYLTFLLSYLYSEDARLEHTSVGPKPTGLPVSQILNKINSSIREKPSLCYLIFLLFANLSYSYPSRKGEDLNLHKPVLETGTLPIMLPFQEFLFPIILLVILVETKS